MSKRSLEDNDEEQYAKKPRLAENLDRELVKEPTEVIL
jgi:hypothetical protein